MIDGKFLKQPDMLGRGGGGGGDLVIDKHPIQEENQYSWLHHAIEPKVKCLASQLNL